MTDAVLSVGTNLGDRVERLRLAVEAFRPWLTGVSPVFETDPVGPVPQADYLNAVLTVSDPDAGPEAWLARGHAAEQLAGRTREVHWGPRTLDVDVVTVLSAGATVTSADPVLTLPHPRAAERAFVLTPWLALDPGARLADEPVARLVAALSEDERTGVRLRADIELA